MKAGPEDGIRIRGPRLLLRPLEPEEIDAAWKDLRDSDPSAVAAGATRVQAPTDAANLAMRAVFDRVGWRERGIVVVYGREWVLYAIERREWEAAAG